MKQLIISNLPLAQDNKIVKYTREDGFNVFLDGDKELDIIRLTEEPTTVIKAVALRRCQQIARNYALSYKPELLHKFEITSLNRVKALKEV